MCGVCSRVDALTLLHFRCVFGLLFGAPSVARFARASQVGWRVVVWVADVVNFGGAAAARGHAFGCDPNVWVAEPASRVAGKDGVSDAGPVVWEFSVVGVPHGASMFWARLPDAGHALEDRSS